MVLTSSDNPSSHVLGKHSLGQETTEDPAKSCYGLRLPEQLLSSAALDEIMLLESKDPKTSGLWLSVTHLAFQSGQHVRIWVNSLSMLARREVAVMYLVAWATARGF